MNATNLYVSTSRLILEAKVEDPSSCSDLYRLFCSLRQSLSCTVCQQLLLEPQTPSAETGCQHHVCRLCKGGKKKLKPSCSWCKDYSKYSENLQLRTLLQCYKKLCLYATSSGICRHLSSLSEGAHFSLESSNHLLELIKEGTLFKDDFKYPPKPISKLLSSPNRSPSTHTGSDGKEDKFKNAIITNGKSPTYSVICADDGNRLTIKRTEKEVNPEHRRNGRPPKKDKSMKRRPSVGRSLNMLKAGRRPGRDNGESNRLKVGRKPKKEIKRHEMRKRSQDQTNVNRGRKRKKRNDSGKELTRPKKRRPHEENISTKINKVRKRSVFTKPPTCKCGVQDHCKGSCRGYRCPCYSADKSCLDCGCLGCKNPRGASLNKASPTGVVEDNQNLPKEKI